MVLGFRFRFRVFRAWSLGSREVQGRVWFGVFGFRAFGSGV